MPRFSSPVADPAAKVCAVIAAIVGFEGACDGGRRRLLLKFEKN